MYFSGLGKFKTISGPSDARLGVQALRLVQDRRPSVPARTDHGAGRCVPFSNCAHVFHMRSMRYTLIGEGGPGGGQKAFSRKLPAMFVYTGLDKKIFHISK